MLMSCTGRKRKRERRTGDVSCLKTKAEEMPIGLTALVQFTHLCNTLVKVA